jgi:Zn-dependent peptidase ImmA (M78 family)
MSRQEALVTPSVLKWARVTAGYDISAAALKLGRPESDIEKWEAGELLPSIAQARKASEVYKRSLAVFYLPEPPKDFQTIRDFRHLPADYPREFSPGLLLLIRQVQSRQEWLKEWLQLEGAKPLKFIGSANIQTPVQNLVNSIRQVLDISPRNQMDCSSRSEALKLWIDRSELVGINMCRQGKIDCKEGRGFVLVDTYAPFIYLNTNDAMAAQLFTLVHELVHLWINSSGISNLEYFNDGGLTQEDKIEIYCNQVASAILLDQNSFVQLWNSYTGALSIEDRINKTSEVFKVSEEVVARRLLQNGIIVENKYKELRKMYADRWRKIKEEEKEKYRSSPGGPSPHLMRVHSNGRRYTQTVISAYNSGAISGRDASGLLGVKINNLQKVAKYAGVDTGSWQ